MGPRIAEKMHKIRKAKDFTQNCRGRVFHKEVNIDCSKHLKNLCECISFALKNYIILKKPFLFFISKSNFQA